MEAVNEAAYYCNVFCTLSACCNFTQALTIERRRQHQAAYFARGTLCKTQMHFPGSAPATFSTAALSFPKHHTISPAK